MKSVLYLCVVIAPYCCFMNESVCAQVLPEEEAFFCGEPSLDWVPERCSVEEKVKINLKCEDLITDAIAYSEKFGEVWRERIEAFFSRYQNAPNENDFYELVFSYDAELFVGEKPWWIIREINYNRATSQMTVATRFRPVSTTVMPPNYHVNCTKGQPFKNPLVHQQPGYEGNAFFDVFQRMVEQYPTLCLEQTAH